MKKKKEIPYLFSATKITTDEMTSGICSRGGGGESGGGGEMKTDLYNDNLLKLDTEPHLFITPPLYSHIHLKTYNKV